MNTAEYLNLVSRVEAYLKLCATEVSIRYLSKRYGVSYTMIQQIVEDSDSLVENIGVATSYGVAEIVDIGDHTVEWCAEEEWRPKFEHKSLIVTGEHTPYAKRPYELNYYRREGDSIVWSHVKKFLTQGQAEAELNRLKRGVRKNAET